MSKINFGFSVACGALLLFGCARQTDVDPLVDEASLYGVYASPPCPPITYENGRLIFPDGSIGAEFVRIKQDNLLKSDQVIRFISDEDGCRLVIVNQGWFNNVRGDHDGSSIIIRSLDLKWYRSFERE